MSKTIELNGRKTIKDSIKRDFNYFIWRILLIEGDVLDDREIVQLVPLYFLNNKYIEFTKEFGIETKVSPFPPKDSLEHWGKFISFSNGLPNALCALRHIVTNWASLNTTYRLRDRHPSLALSDEPASEIMLLAQSHPSRLMDLVQLYKTEIH